MELFVCFLFDKFDSRNINSLLIGVCFIVLEFLFLDRQSNREGEATRSICLKFYLLTPPPPQKKKNKYHVGIELSDRLSYKYR